MNTATVLLLIDDLLLTSDPGVASSKICCNLKATHSGFHKTKALEYPKYLSICGGSLFA